MPGKVDEEALLTPPETLLRRACLDDERAHVVTVVPQGERELWPLPADPARGERAVDPDRDVGQLERARDGTGDRPDHLVRLQRVGELLAETGERAELPSKLAVLQRLCDEWDSGRADCRSRKAVEELLVWAGVGQKGPTTRQR